MDEISEQTRLLVSNNIETDKQFFLFAKNKNDELNILIGEREKLWYKYKKNDSNKDEIKVKINSITKDINNLRRVIKLCDGIKERCYKIEEVVKEVEKNERKGEKKYELK